MEESEEAPSPDEGAAPADEETTEEGKYDRYVEYLLDLLSFF